MRKREFVERTSAVLLSLGYSERKKRHFDEMACRVKGGTGQDRTRQDRGEAGRRQVRVRAKTRRWVGLGWVGDYKV